MAHSFAQITVMRKPVLLKKVSAVTAVAAARTSICAVNIAIGAVHTKQPSSHGGPHATRRLANSDRERQKLCDERREPGTRDRGTELAATLRTMIATIAVTMAIVGATLGSYRGGGQIAYAAVKLPVVLLGTAALSAPALSAIGAALGRRSRLAADLALVMAALAFGSLLLVASGDARRALRYAGAAIQRSRRSTCAAATPAFSAPAAGRTRARRRGPWRIDLRASPTLPARSGPCGTTRSSTTCGAGHRAARRR